jgi:hypothetical protein
LSQSNDIFVQYTVQGLDKVTDSLKTIEEHLNRVQRKSEAAFKARSGTSAGKASAEGRAEAGAAVRSMDMVAKAKRNGNKKIADQAEADANAHSKKVSKVLQKAAADDSAAYSQWNQKKLRDGERGFQAQATAHSRAEAQRLRREEASRARSEKAARQAGDKDYNKFAKGVDSRKEASSTYAGKFAARQVAAKEKLEREIRRATNSAIKGEQTHGPGMGPLARRKMLEGLRGNENPEEIHKAIEHSRELADTNAARAARDKKRTASEKAENDKRLANDRTSKKKAQDQEAAHETFNRKGRLEAHIKEAADDRKKTQKTQKEAARRAKLRDSRIERLVLRPAASEIASAARSGFSHTANALASVPGRVAGHLLAAGGGFSIDQSVQERVQFERNAARLANKVPGGSRPKKDIMDTSAALATKYHYDRGEVAGAWERYIDKSGLKDGKDYQNSKKDVEFFLKYAKVTGDDVGDVASVAGQLKDANPHLTPDLMRKLQLEVLGQGRAGSIDTRELTAYVKGYAKTAAYYAGDLGANQSKLLGMSQVVAGTNTSAAEGASSLSNVATNAQAHSDAIEAFMNPTNDPKKKIFDDKHRINKRSDLFMGDIIEKAGGDLQTISTMGSGKQVFGVRAMRAFTNAARPFNEASDQYLKEHPGDKKGAIKAGREAYDKFVEEKTGKAVSEGELDKDFASMMNTSAEKFEAAVRELKEKVGDELVPVLLQLVPTLKELIPQIASLIKFIGSLMPESDKRDAEIADLLSAPAPTTPEGLAERKKAIQAIGEQGDYSRRITLAEGLGNAGALIKDLTIGGGLPKLLMDSADPSGDGSKKDWLGTDSYVKRDREQQIELAKKSTAMAEAIDQLTVAYKKAAAEIAPGGGTGKSSVANPKAPGRGPAPNGGPQRTTSQ